MTQVHVKATKLKALYVQQLMKTWCKGGDVGMCNSGAVKSSHEPVTPWNEKYNDDLVLYFSWIIIVPHFLK